MLALCSYINTAKSLTEENSLIKVSCMFHIRFLCCLPIKTKPRCWKTLNLYRYKFSSGYKSCLLYTVVNSSVTVRALSMLSCD